MFISRDLLTDIRQWLDREKILILKGSRQVGKTTLLKFLEQELKKEYPTLFFSIDLEIDFILHCRGAMIPLEVKYRKGEQRIPLEIKNFSGRYPDKVNKTLIITRDYLHQEGNHYFIPYLVFPFMQL